MAELDPGAEPSSNLEALKPLRPGAAPLLDPRFVSGMSAPQLLRRQSRTLATSKLPELEGNLFALANALPMETTGAGRGFSVNLDPELNMRSSRIMPWLGTLDSPEFVNDVKKLRLQSEKAAALIGGTKGRHMLETERMVRRIHSFMRNISPEDIGYTIRLGLANPGVATKPATVREVYTIAAYLLSGAVPPEAASMGGMGRAERKRTQSRHAVRIAREAGLDDMGYVFGTNRPEHLRRLELMQGSKGYGHMLASMGLQQPRSEALGGEFFQEQILTPEKPAYTPFEQRIRDLMTQDSERVARAARAMERRGIDPKFRQRIGATYKVALGDYISEILSGGHSEAANAPNALVRRTMVPREMIDEFIDEAFAEAGTGSAAKTPEFNSLQHFRKTTARVRSRMLENLELSGRNINPDTIEAIERMTQDFPSEFAKAVEASHSISKEYRNVARQTVAVAGAGRIAKERAGSSVAAALEKDAARTLKAMGRNMPSGGVPMFLVSALAAGLLASGLLHEEAA